MKALQQLRKLRWQRPAGRWGLVLLALLLSTGVAQAQRAPRHYGRRPAPPPAPPVFTPADTTRQVVELPAATLDSLAAQPLAEPAVDSVRLVWLQTPPTLADLVGDRLGCVETDAPHQCNAAVLAYVRLFTERQRGYTQRVLEREQFYFPVFEKYLAQYNLPTDLKYLSVVESALLPTARSPVGALGLWQFMGPTASDLRLRRDEWVDERMAPEKATEAACKHLRYLYGVFHDWELVLAAYNWGAGNVQRVIRRTGKHNFWELYPSLPAETRNYVPTFTAILYAMKYAQEHQLHDPTLRYQRYEPLDTLGVRGQALDLRRLSRALGYADSLALNRFNPELKRGALPAGYRPYVLRYPSAAREHLGTVDRATLLAYCQPLGDLPQALAGRPVRLAGVAPWLTGPEPAASDPVAGPAEATPRRRLYYVVRRGQTVAGLAEKFDVSPAQLRRWNELPRHVTKLRPGRELLVLLPRPATTDPAPAAVIAAAPDGAARALAAANARYAQEAQEKALRETARLRELARMQQQTARALAQRQAAARALMLAQAQAAAKAQLALADAEAADDSPEAAAPAAAPDSSAAPAPGHSLKNKPLMVSTSHPLKENENPAASQPVGALVSTKRTPYRVRPGDNLTKIAREHDLSVAQLRALNPRLTEQVAPGQLLQLSAAEAPATLADQRRPAAAPLPRLGTHTVQPGDTLFNISRRFGVSVEQLRRLNHLSSDHVKLGQKLVVQAG